MVMAAAVDAAAAPDAGNSGSGGGFDVGSDETAVTIAIGDIGGIGLAVHAVPDEATTYTGHAIQIDVLGNDYHADGTTPLVLDSIASGGRHGACTVVGDVVTASVSMQVLYEPDGGYSGSDECAYRACAAADDDGDGDECSVATVSIVIAKQLEAAEFEYDAVDVDDVGVDAAEPSTAVPDIVGNGTTASGDPIIGFDRMDSCTPGEEALLTLELQTDEHGGDVTWEMREVVSSTALRRFRKGGPYARYSYDRVDVCVRSPGAYTFVIFDAYGDGMCDPGSGGGGSGATTCGYYRLYLDGREIVDVSHYGASNTHSINVGYDPLPHMSDRHVEYLDAHNTRRRSWHEMHGVSYVPLLWSPGLAEDSARWAEALLDDCDSDDIEHETGVMEGENLAKNKGYEYEDGVPSWGQLYPPESMCFTLATPTTAPPFSCLSIFCYVFLPGFDMLYYILAPPPPPKKLYTPDIVGRWVDREIGWLYPKNAHLTQSLSVF